MRKDILLTPLALFSFKKEKGASGEKLLNKSITNNMEI
jgi:hypothetical protein